MSLRLLKYGQNNPDYGISFKANEGDVIWFGDKMNFEVRLIGEKTVGKNEHPVIGKSSGLSEHFDVPEDGRYVLFLGGDFVEVRIDMKRGECV